MDFSLSEQIKKYILVIRSHHGCNGSISLSFEHDNRHSDGEERDGSINPERIRSC